MCFLPCKDKKGPCTHRLVHPTFIRTVTVTPGNVEEIAKALGIKAATLKPGGTLHVVHEAGPKRKRRR